MEIKYDIEGTVSPSAYFKTKRNLAQIYPDKQAISLIAYLQMLNDTKIHEWSQEILKNMPFPDPTTSLADLKTQQDKITRVIEEIEQNRKRLDGFLQFVHPRERGDQFNLYKVQLDEYFNRTIGEFAKLSRFYTATEFQQLPGVRDHSVERLARFALELNNKTEEFMKQRNISDQDAHYSYREWHV